MLLPFWRDCRGILGQADAADGFLSVVALCEARVVGYQCNCVNGWSGPTCEVPQVIYVLGGVGLNAVEAYNPATNHWSNIRPMHQTRRHLAAAALEGKIYAIAGFNSSGQTTNTAEMYNPAEGEWSAIASMATARYGPAAVQLGRKIYVLGGTSGGTSQDWYFLNSVESYDPTTNKWAAIEPMRYARKDLAAVVLSGKIYALGGQNYSVCSDAVEAYDPATEKWTTLASMRSRRGSCAAVAMGGKIYALGGTSAFDDFLNSAEVYDPKTNQWLAIE
eukprot:COSAG05_NODE_5356_length_1198_cov_3.199272_1_plen_276_part_00